MAIHQRVMAPLFRDCGCTLTFATPHWAYELKCQLPPLGDTTTLGELCARPRMRATCQNWHARNMVRLQTGRMRPLI